MHIIHKLDCPDYDKYFGTKIYENNSTDQLNWRNVKPNDDGRFNCFDCDKTFADRHAVRKHHKRVHMRKNNIPSAFTAISLIIALLLRLFQDGRHNRAKMAF